MGLLEVEVSDDVAPMVGAGENADPAKLRAARKSLNRTDEAGRQEHAAARLNAVLGELARAATDEAFESATEQFGAYLDGDPGTPPLASWLHSRAEEWVLTHERAGAIVLDGVVQYGLAGLGELIASVLERATDPMLLRVAIHRARHIAFGDERSRERAWAAFQVRLPQLAESSTTLAALLPSAAHLGREHAIPLLLGYLDSEDASLSGAAAIGLLDLSSKRARPPARPSAEAREAIASKALSRLAARRDAAAHHLIWLLGSVATSGNIEVIAAVLAQSFVHGSDLETAAAARAAGNVLQDDFPADALMHLVQAVLAADGEQLNRFLALALFRRPT